MPDLRAFLEGTWSVDRVLLDRSTGTRGTFTGTVTFAADDGGLLQSEHGTFRWGAHEGPASREYLWRPGASSAAMVVFFPDGRLFHHVDLSHGAMGDRHWCSPDDYAVRYEALGPDELHYEWDVRGPAKDQLLTTSLRRR